VIEPDGLGRELEHGAKLSIICVGFERLYRSAHIAGAAYHGPASKPEGLAV
jgi:hypothetical protein